MRKKIIASILLLLIVIAPSLALADDYTGWDEGSWGSGYSGSIYYSYGLPGGTLYGIIRNILNWTLTILGIAGIIGFAISGIMYLISSGDDDMISKAKKGMQYSIVGVIVGLSGFVIIQAVDAILNARTNF